MLLLPVDLENEGSLNTEGKKKRNQLVRKRGGIRFGEEGLQAKFPKGNPRVLDHKNSAKTKKKRWLVVPTIKSMNCSSASREKGRNFTIYPTKA